MNRDPFTGFKLTEAAQPQKLDQRLFAPRPAPKAEQPPPVRFDPPIEQQKADGADLPAGAGQGLTFESLTRDFKLADVPLYRNTYIFTAEELEAIEDLRLELRRELDTKVNKNDLIRCGLHMLVEDYAKSGATSYVRRKIQKRPGVK